MDTMAIADLSMSMSKTNLMQEVNISVLKQSIEQNSENMLNLMKTMERPMHPDSLYIDTYA